MIFRFALLMICLLAVACGPQRMSPNRAYDQCSERARQAAGPTGRIGIGVGSEGLATDLDLTITSDFIAGRDPNIVYENCFRQLTGAGPTRPLGRL